MGIHHIGGEASRGLRHPHGHSNEQYKRVVIVNLSRAEPYLLIAQVGRKPVFGMNDDDNNKQSHNTG